MLAFADCRDGPMKFPITETNMPLIEVLQKPDGGDFLRAVTEAELQKPGPKT